MEEREQELELEREREREQERERELEREREREQELEREREQEQELEREREKLMPNKPTTYHDKCDKCESWTNHKTGLCHRCRKPQTKTSLKPRCIDCGAYTFDGKGSERCAPCWYDYAVFLRTGVVAAANTSQSWNSRTQFTRNL